MLLNILRILILCWANLYTSRLLNRTILCRKCLIVAKTNPLLRILHGKYNPILLSHELRVSRSSQNFDPYLWQIPVSRFDCLEKKKDRVVLYIFWDLFLSSRIISFIINAFSLASLSSFPVAQTFEHIIYHMHIWQFLSSQTSRWNMQAHGTPARPNFHRKFSLDRLIIRKTTKDSTRRSFSKCSNLSDFFSQKMGASISRHNFDPHLWQTLFYALDCMDNQASIIASSMPLPVLEDHFFH